MNKEINNDIFFKFVNSNLSSDEMREVSALLQKTGEYNSAMESAIACYRTNLEYANEIIGVDVEDFQNNHDMVDRNMVFVDSTVADNSSSTIKNDNIMDNKLVKEDFTKISTLVENFNSVKDSTLSLDENLVNYYLSHFPGTFPEEAHEIVNKVKCGVTAFNTTLNEAIANNGIDYIEKLKSLGEGKTNEEKYEVYINFLTTLTVLDSTNFGGDNSDIVESFDDIKNKIYVVKESVSDEELDELISKVAEALNNTTFIMSSAEMINQIVEQLPAGEESVKEIVRGSEEDYKLKMITSLLAFICHQKGELESANETELSVEQITINVCSGMEEARTLNDVKKGILTVDKALKLIKIIGGISLFLTLTTAFFNVSANFGLFISGLILGLFGTSTLITVLASVVGLIASVGLLCVAVRDIIPDAIDWTENAFDAAVKAWRETAWPFIIDVKNSFADWIRSLIEQKKVEPVDNSTYDNNVIIGPINA